MITRVAIEPDAHEYAWKHKLLAQLHKAAQKIKSGNNAGVDLKKRKPKS